MTMNLLDFAQMAVTAIAGALGAVGIFELVESLEPRSAESAQLHRWLGSVIRLSQNQKGPFAVLGHGRVLREDRVGQTGEGASGQGQSGKTIRERKKTKSRLNRTTR